VTGQAGTLLGGRYRLGEPIGRGGMGAVWRALDTVLDREVAIKTMALQVHENPDASERFRREARVLARLSHPRLGGVYDYGEENGQAFMAMEFLTGETLQCRVARLGRIPAADAAEIAAQVAEGLHAAHQAGVIHRDVKPGNIILAEQGVKLVDFGIALGAGDDRLTVTGTLVGSATYLAPELCAGRPATYASDVYSLAVVLYQMLAGTPPFTSSDPVQLVSAHAHDPVPPLPGDVPTLLAQCCMRAMEKEPARRPASALAFATMLRASTGRGRHAPVTQTGLPTDSVLAGHGPTGHGLTGHPGSPPEGDFSMGGAAMPGSPPIPGCGAFGESVQQYGNRSGRATQVLPLNESWQARPRRWRRWWLPAVAVATAVVAGTAIAVAAAGTSRTRHPAKPSETAAAHTHQASPSVPPAPMPPSSLPATSWALTIGTQNPGQPQPPVLAPPGTTVRLAETLLNSTQQPVTSATLGLSAPQGWTVTPESPPTVGSLPAGGKASVTWRISIPAATQAGGFNLTATATCVAATSCAAAPATGNAVVPYAEFSQAFNNAGIAPQADNGAANLDGTGKSYQAEALAAAGYLPGGQVTHDGISFAWPDASPGAPDNVVAQGQTFLLPATGAHLAFLGAAAFGSSGGDGTIFYQNGTQQAFHLVMDDWWANQATPGQDEIAVTTAHPNGPPGQPPLTGPQVAVYFASIPLQQGSTVAAVMLPAGSAPAANTASLHLFAVAVG
jgi:serine/threonine protein kinase